MFSACFSYKIMSRQIYPQRVSSDLLNEGKNIAHCALEGRFVDCMRSDGEVANNFKTPL